MFNSRINDGQSKRTSRLCVAVLATACLLLTSALLFEGHFWPRLAGKLQPARFTYDRAEVPLLRAMASQAQHQLLHPQPRHLSRSPELRLEGWLRGSRLPIPADSWMQASLALGLADAHGGAPEPVLAAALKDYASQLFTANGAWREPLHNPEQAFAGWFLLRHALQTKDAAARQACDQLAQFLLNRYPRSSTGTLPYSPARPDAMLVDTLGLLCPFLAQHAQAADRIEAADLAARQLLEFQTRAVDPHTGLPWHAYRAGSGGGYGLLGWARGSGWLLIGLSETLACLPPDHPSRPALMQALQQGVRAVLDRQRPDGLWGWCLTIPEAEPDTSGTAMILWALARTEQLGLRSAPLQTARVNGLNALARHVDQSGRLTQALAECQAVGHYPRSFGSFAFAQGLATSAVALNLKIATE
jgi:rhamnogalacturonyl hydrolase YesR